MRIVPQVDDSRELDLFRRAQTGDRGAFGQLAIRLQDRLYNAILRVVGDHEEARELTQETFVKALMKIDSFRGDSQPFTWLFRIGVNLAISHLRKVKRRRTFSLDAPGYGSHDDQASGLIDRLSRDGEASPSRAMEQRETQQLVLVAMGKLDAEYRAILVMRDIEEMDYQQMADVLNLPLGTLKSKLFRARLALRENLVVEMKK
jgi:RNA polymerase sigma-70 factor (ECF subfamily)